MGFNPADFDDPAPAPKKRSGFNHADFDEPPPRPPGPQNSTEAVPGPTTSLRFPGTGEDEPGPIHDDSYMGLADRLIFNVVGPAAYDATKEGERALKNAPEVSLDPRKPLTEPEPSAPGANLPPSPLLTPRERDIQEGERVARDLRARRDAEALGGMKQGIKGGQLAGQVSTGIALGGVLPTVAAVSTGRSLAPVAAPAATALGRALQSGGQAAASSVASRVIEDVGNNVPVSDIPGRAAVAGATGFGTGAVIQGATDLLRKPAAAVAAAADKKLITAEAQDIVAGADPTHARRAVGRAGETAEPVVEFARRHPEVKEAVAAGGTKLADAAERVVEKAAAPTGAIYDRLDKVVGKVPVRDVVSQLDEAIAAEQTPGGSDLLERSLEAVKARVARIAEKSGGVEKAQWTHKELRSWVTRLLKEEQSTMGGIAETERYAIKDALHRTGDQILKNRLNTIETMSKGFAPEVASDIETLRKANLDVAMGLRVQQVAENAAAREYWKKAASGGDKIAAGIGALVGFGGAGALGGVAAAGLVKAAPMLAKGGNRLAVQALFDLSNHIAKGTAGPEAVAAAVAAGVPQRIAEDMYQRRQSPRTIGEAAP
jgi:hypothetical protein